MKEEARPIRGVVFDWGGVLIDDPASGLLDHCRRALGCEDVTKFVRAMQRWTPDFQRGALPEWKFWDGVCKGLGVQPPAGDRSLWREAVEAVFKFRRAMWQAVAALNDRGYKTGFLSNTEGAAARFFRDKGLEAFFDAAVFSCYEGCIKPEPLIYERCAARMELAPEELVLVDDKLENIQGAVACGWNGWHFESQEATLEWLRTEFGIRPKV